MAHCDCYVQRGKMRPEEILTIYEYAEFRSWITQRSHLNSLSKFAQRRILSTRRNIMKTSKALPIALAALISISSLASEAATQSLPLTVQPWLCANQGDGSSAGFVNANGQLQVLLNLTQQYCDGGANIENIYGKKAGSVGFSIPSTQVLQLGGTTGLKAFVFGTVRQSDGTVASFDYELKDPKVAGSTMVHFSANIGKMFNSPVTFNFLRIGIGQASAPLSNACQFMIEDITVDGNPVSAIDLHSGGCLLNQ